MPPKHELSPHSHMWGETTDPITHNPNSFRYLVHAINPSSPMFAAQFDLTSKLDGITYDESWGNQKISMLDQPERVAERVSLSMSLIDQGNTSTWGNAGLIIGAPEENIVLTSEKDAGTNNSHLNYLRVQGDVHGIMSADDLLFRTSPNTYNEVVAIADQDGSKLELRGFFLKTTSKGELLDPNLANIMIMNAQRLGLPIIELPTPSPYAENKVRRYVPYGSEREHITITFNEKHILASGFNDEDSFKIKNETGASCFAAPQEIEAAVSYAITAGNITEDEATKLLESYSEKDTKRKTPTAEYDKDGNFIRIIYFEGYGDNEYSITLNNSGYGYVTNTKLYRDFRSKRLSQQGSNITSIENDISRHPLNSHEQADNMVTQAAEQLNSVKAAHLQKWYEDHKVILEKQWRVQKRGI